MVGPPGPLSGGKRVPSASREAIPFCCLVVFYFRWGSTSCPNVLLYLGQIVKAKSSITEREGGYLCLANNPTPSNFRLEKPDLSTKLVNIHDKEGVPCTACASRQKETVIIIPNTPLCPAGWTLEYSGILATNPKYPVDNICVDNAEAAKLSASKPDELAAVVEMMLYKEGYTPQAAVACAVCSI